MTTHDHDTNAVEVTDAVVSFGPLRAVDHVSLDVGATEVLALLGPSGCGKSTLLRAIAGLVDIDHGSIRLGGVLVDDGRHRQPPEKRRVGLVFQEHSLFPHLTVLDNVLFGIRDTGRRPATARAVATLEMVELGGHQNRYPHELSGGERQRVALARALAPQPSLLLLDEPFASLDPNLREQLRRQVAGVLAAASVPAVFVTHDQTEAMSIGDRVAVMRAGRIEQVADPSTVFHDPANRFVAAFLGEASFLVVHTAGGRAHTALGPLDAAPDAPAVAMVRPDDVEFGPAADGEAMVTGVEFRGARWSCTIDLADGQTIVAERPHTAPIEVGTRGSVTLRPGHRQTLVPDDR